MSGTGLERRPAPAVLPAVPLAVVALQVLALPASFAAAGDLALPPDIAGIRDVRVVVAEGESGGRAVSVSAFSSAHDAQRTAGEVERAWRASEGAAAHVVRAARGPWQMVSRLVDDGYETLQVRDRPGGSDGFVTRWGGAPERSGPRFDAAAILPPGASIVRRLASRDAGRDAATVVALLADPVARAAGVLDARLRERGFARDPHFALPAAATAPGARAAGAHAAAYRGPRGDVVLTLEPRAGGAALVLHHAETER